MTATTTTPDAALVSARRGWYWYGWASHVFPTLITTVFMSRYLGAVAEDAVGTNGRLHVLGIPIAPQSLFVYTVSTCTVLLVVLMPVVGAIADRTGRKRDILCGLGAVGALACVAMFGVTGGNWQLGAALYAVAFIAYSSAAVVNYALLVDLSDHDDRDPISSYGWGVSYLGGGLQPRQSQQWGWPIKSASRLPASSITSSDRSTISDKSLKEIVKCSPASLTRLLKDPMQQASRGDRRSLSERCLSRASTLAEH